MMEVGFDSTKYIKAQKKKILERIGKFEKLYLEFGGKLLYDHHATRVLPGYNLTTKIDLLKQFDEAEIIYCVNANYIEKGYKLTDSNLTHDGQALRDIKGIEKFGLKVSNVIIMRYEKQPKAKAFKDKLEKLGYNAHLFNDISYDFSNIKNILEGYSKQKLIPTKNKLVIVTGVGGGSGKMSFALSQIYKERKKGVKVGFAKFETFPIWNLPLNHPVNIAYEAATADLQDINMIDPFHKKAYKIDAVNYNRDIENFTILQNLMEKLTKEKNPFGYKSPTDMGVNMAKAGITDDDICKEAGKKEIKRRYKIYSQQVKEGVEEKSTIERMKVILEKV
jgi:uncharacterized protein (UPF0371 family)